MGTPYIFCKQKGKKQKRQTVVLQTRLPETEASPYVKKKYATQTGFSEQLYNSEETQIQLERNSVSNHFVVPMYISKNDNNKLTILLTTRFIFHSVISDLYRSHPTGRVYNIKVNKMSVYGKSVSLAAGISQGFTCIYYYYFIAKTLCHSKIYRYTYLKTWSE